MATELLGIQVRMARAALRWSIATLAKRAKIGISSVQAIEAKDGPPAIGAGLDATRDYRAAERAKVAAAIGTALVAAGVSILPDDGKGAGVRIKPSGKVKRGAG
jgi:transcriptional regulator with XRE-family HTH domain